MLAAMLVAGLAGCGQAQPAQEQQASPPQTAPAELSPQQLARLPETTTFTTIAGTTQDPAPLADTDGTVLHPERELAVYASPSGPAIARLPTTEVGSPTWLPVIAQQGLWSQVLLPSRPNASTGWVNTANGAATESRSGYRIDVNRSRFEMTVSRSGQVLGRWLVGVGTPQFPTPAGRTFVLALIKETVPTYSPLILPLGWHSDSHETFGGGPGTVGLHGWPDSSPFGKASSNGCIRVPPDALRLLSTLPLGTMVFIT